MARRSPPLAVQQVQRFSAGLLSQAKEPLSALAGHALTPVEVEESVSNLVGFVELLLRWKAEERAITSNRPADGTRDIGRASLTASKSSKKKRPVCPRTLTG